jgi:hypothetical protein
LITLTYTDAGIGAAPVGAFLATLSSLGLGVQLGAVENRPTVRVTLKGTFDSMKQQAAALIDSLRKLDELKGQPLQAVASSAADSAVFVASTQQGCDRISALEAKRLPSTVQSVAASDLRSAVVELKAPRVVVEKAGAAEPIPVDAADSLARAIRIVAPVEAKFAKPLADAVSQARAQLPAVVPAPAASRKAMLHAVWFRAVFGSAKPDLQLMARMLADYKGDLDVNAVNPASDPELRLSALDYCVRNRHTEARRLLEQHGAVAKEEKKQVCLCHLRWH